MAVVREMTLSALICERSVISASVKPSAKYSWAESLDKFVSGRTARDRIFVDVVLLRSLSRKPPMLNPATTIPASTATAPVTAITPTQFLLLAWLFKRRGLRVPWFLNRADRCSTPLLNPSHQPVAPLGDRLDESRFLRVGVKNPA